jgi:hypothetical protein
MRGIEEKALESKNAIEKIRNEGYMCTYMKGIRLGYIHRIRLTIRRPGFESRKSIVFLREIIAMVLLTIDLKCIDCLLKREMKAVAQKFSVFYVLKTKKN